MTELDEVAETMRDALPAGGFATGDEYRAFVRERMPDETPNVIDGVAWSLQHGAWALK